MSASLGGLIRDLRNQKNISQLEVAFALGWKEPSRLSRIEQGKVDKPPRDLLEKLMNAMKLSPEEKNRLYMAGNYLPTKEDIESAKKYLQPLVDQWPYPASAMDYSWRVICGNQKIYELYDLDPKQQKMIEEKTPNIMEIIFTPGFTGEQGDEKFYIRILAQFQYDQRTRTGEKWYLDLVRRMMNFDTFRKLWPIVGQQTSFEYDVLNFTAKKLKGLSFLDFVMPVFNDSRYFVEYYTPADQKTFEKYQIKAK